MPIDPRFLQPGTISQTGQVRFGAPTLPTPPVQEKIPQAPVIPPVTGPININSQNPAIQNLVNMVNSTLAAGGTITPETLTPELRSAIDKVNNLEMDKNLAIANARDAADKQDVGGLDETMAAVDETEKTQTNVITKELLAELIAEQREARESLITSLTPTEQETELKSRLNTLRTERQLLPVELKQQGISQRGIEAGQINDERVRSIQEQNLLLEIGLEQEARTFKTSVLEKQLGFISDDIDLQFKIEDRLKKDEQDILDEARTMRKDSLAAMADIVGSFEGLAYEDLDIESQSEVLDLAKQFNIPANLLASAMRNAKQQKIYDRAKKGEESAVDVKQRRADLADLLGQVASYGSREEALTDLEKFKSSMTTRVGEDGFVQIQSEVDRLFPPPEESAMETGGGTGGVVGFFKRLFGK